jgi:TRAP-type C4-dicarboxylate transport system permease small subunit
MSGLRIVAFVLIIAGALALAYGGFTYTKDTHTANLGPLSFSVEEKERVNIPMWAGLAAVIVGGLLLVTGGGRRS